MEVEKLISTIWVVHWYHSAYCDRHKGSFEVVNLHEYTDAQVLSSKAECVEIGDELGEILCDLYMLIPEKYRVIPAVVPLNSEQEVLAAISLIDIGYNPLEEDFGEIIFDKLLNERVSDNKA